MDGTCWRRWRGRRKGRARAGNFRGAGGGEARAKIGEKLATLKRREEAERRGSINPFGDKSRNRRGEGGEEKKAFITFHR